LIFFIKIFFLGVSTTGIVVVVVQPFTGHVTAELQLLPTHTDHDNTPHPPENPVDHHPVDQLPELDHEPLVDQLPELDQDQLSQENVTTILALSDAPTCVHQRSNPDTIATLVNHVVNSDVVQTYPVLAHTDKNPIVRAQSGVNISVTCNPVRSISPLLVTVIAN
jgi:hypothetical protein